ncbi:hypothetical protein TYRP_015343 [Tyrophagus putrescentiae]|nr:hypothetical protein TYRP_015343 [Tyrophagus putrescentiae]
MFGYEKSGTVAINDFLKNEKNQTVHSTRRRGLAPLVHFKLPLPRVLRAKRAGPEAAEV